MSGRRQNLARDLKASDLAVRRAAEERLPEFLNEAFGTAMAVLHNRQDAQDALGDALKKWIARPEKYSDNYKASDLTWFKTVVRNTAIDYLRKRYIELRLPTQEEVDSVSEMVELLYLAIGGLDAPYQRVLRQYLAWDDAPNPKRVGVRLAEALGVSDKTAKARFVAALAALSREMHRLMETPFQDGESTPADQS